MPDIRKQGDYSFHILIFGGTAEGRQVSDYLCEKHVAHTVSVATEYGEEVLRPQPERHIHQGRLDMEQMRDFLRDGQYALVVDATHPYAVEVSKNIQEACRRENVQYLRYLRTQNERCDNESIRVKKGSGKQKSLDRADMWGTSQDYAEKTESACAEKTQPARENAGEIAGAVYVDSAREAADYLETRQGGIFLTTGSKELYVFTETISDKNRIFARVLPSAEVVSSCRALGLEGKHICAMQGPFSADMNASMLRQAGSAFLVTKETGATGGFPEKIEAARQCQVTPVIIRRPKETGSGWKEVKERLDALISGECTLSKDILRKSESVADKQEAECQDTVRGRTKADKPESGAGKSAAGQGRMLPDESGEESPIMERSGHENSRCISCIGIGMGTPDTLTREAARKIREAEVIFGAARILECARVLLCESEEISASSKQPESAFEMENKAKAPLLIPEYNARKIASWLEAHPQVERVAILMSGDVGFYSGARQVAETFPAEQVRYYCGISSVVYFASKIPTSWQDAKLLSAHGKEIPLVNYVKKYPKIILLVSGAKEVGEICQDLVLDGIGSYVRVTVGSNLSYPDEKIQTGRPEDFIACKETGPHIMMLENAHAGRVITPGIPDDAFERWEKVPMTKEEIRALSVAKLRLREESVVYDVGAGTGSVSVECARLCTEGRVYAIERELRAMELIKQNTARFHLSNLIPISGTAPQAMEELPAPTHAFIGGSSGNMREIVASLLEKNSSVRIVINTVALESIAEVTSLLNDLEIKDADIVQVSVAKSRRLGRYHMMSSLNPIYIVSFGGEEIRENF
ncbi:MAG: precorrin-6y C5,15-methyltransferase (decarboxylating) subunit CbiE [Lachnospiraceae bacterium]|nr:precorrin-6y C5,15-methyltransferase (decarboxylating) subunit CbiE [Lachnospiraceae bacterium]